MKKVLSRMMIMVCLVVTCISVTGCWDGDIEEEDTVVEIEGTEDQLFSYDLGYDFASKNVTKTILLEELYVELDKMIAEYPDRLDYDFYLRGAAQACEDIGRHTTINNVEVSSYVYYSYTVAKYQIHCDWIDYDTKYNAVAYMLSVIINTEYPDLGAVKCEFAYREYDKVGCEVYNFKKQLIGMAYYNMETDTWFCDLN